MNNFYPLPPPGLAIIPSYLQNNPTTLVLRNNTLSGSFKVDLAGGGPVLKFKGDPTATTGTKTIIDERTNQQLGTLKKTSDSKHGRWSLTLSGQPMPVMQTETRKQGGDGFFSLHKRYEMMIQLMNVANGGMPEHLTFASDSYSEGPIAIMWRGGIVAHVEPKRGGLFRDECVVSLAPGLDPCLVAAIAVLWHDKEKDDNSSSTS